MAYYETVFIARQDISANQVEDLTKVFNEAINENGGKIINTENWGLRTLAYRIKKNRKGHYVMSHIDAPAKAIHEMERQMRINEDVLRYLTMKVDAFEDGPSLMLKSHSNAYQANDDDTDEMGDSMNHGVDGLDSQDIEIQNNYDIENNCILVYNCK